MSFSQEVKTELTEVRLRRGSDGAKLVAGATFAAASLKYSREHRTWGLHYVSESALCINFIAKLAAKSYELEPEISLNVHQRLHARNTELFLYGKDTDKLCEDAGLISFDENGDKSFETRIPDGLESEHACRAFIRGVFLACGSVSDPSSGCHAELVFKNEAVASKVAKLLAERGIPPKVSKRKNLWVVYMKNGDTVEDFLTFMGAGESMLAVRDGRMIREAANNSNREVNCLVANMEKAAKASTAQVEDIKLIICELGVDCLSEELYEVAEARMANPELTLTELAEKVGIGRSAVNYRLKKIQALAADIRSGSRIGDGK
ncbi:MAG: DNA-binding protein WhiA [Clostridiales bacterium]|nr:DNA-binding protein WhiA [Clostridiales bacterium]